VDAMERRYLINNKEYYFEYYIEGNVNFIGILETI
jgi:hypothetical protein